MEFTFKKDGFYAVKVTNAYGELTATKTYVLRAPRQGWENAEDVRTAAFELTGVGKDLEKQGFKVEVGDHAIYDLEITLFYPSKKLTA